MSDYNEIMSRTFRTVLLNDENMTDALHIRAMDAIRTDCGYESMDLATFQMHERDGLTYVLADVVGLMIRDYVHDSICSPEVPADSVARMLALELMDYGNRELWADVAGAFMPDADTYGDFLTEYGFSVSEDAS